MRDNLSVTVLPSSDTKVVTSAAIRSRKAHIRSAHGRVWSRPAWHVHGAVDARACTRYSAWDARLLTRELAFSGARQCGIVADSENGCCNTGVRSYAWLDHMGSGLLPLVLASCGLAVGNLIAHSLVRLGSTLVTRRFDFVCCLVIAGELALAYAIYLVGVLIWLARGCSSLLDSR
jgi:hypothetical protein